jgi:cysteine-rich repeat protein
VHPVTKPFSKLRRRSWATRFLATAGITAAMLGGGDVGATVATFPSMGWVVATNSGQAVTDIQGDTQGSRDIVGDAANPMLYIASDANHLFFRLRVDSDPLQNPTNFKPFGWGCLINTDSDLTTFEYSAFINGVANPDELNFYKNTMTTSPNDPTDPPEITLSTTINPLSTTVGHARAVSAPSMFGGTPDFFIDWAVEMSDLVAGGFNPANPANYYCGSSNNGSTLTADCSGGTICGGLDTQFTDPITCGPLGCYVCGDGTKGAAEGCDDGNQTNGDGCNSVCLIELGQACMGTSTACASGFCDPAGNICACDADADCPTGQSCNTTPNPNVCVTAGCGNSILDVGEGCDDGNKGIGTNLRWGHGVRKRILRSRWHRMRMQRKRRLPHAERV